MGLIILYWVLLAVMLIGIVGAVVPGLPGSSLILVSILIWGVATGFSGVGFPLIFVIFVLILSTLVDYLAVVWGAKRFGASKWGQIGAIVGLVLGFFGLLPTLPFGGPLLGIFFGPILGAFVGEFIHRRDLALNRRIIQAFKSSIGIVVGSLIGNLIQGVLAVAAVAVFISSTWSLLGAL